VDSNVYDVAISGFHVMRRIIYPLDALNVGVNIGINQGLDFQRHQPKIKLNHRPLKTLKS
jgi:hypothetical protein